MHGGAGEDPPLSGPCTPRLPPPSGGSGCIRGFSRLTADALSEGSPGGAGVGSPAAESPGAPTAPCSQALRWVSPGLGFRKRRSPRAYRGDASHVCSLNYEHALLLGGESAERAQGRQEAPQPGAGVFAERLLPGRDELHLGAGLADRAPARGPGWERS